MGWGRLQKINVMNLYLQPDKAMPQRGIAKFKLGITDAGSRLPVRLLKPVTTLRLTRTQATSGVQMDGRREKVFTDG